MGQKHPLTAGAIETACPANFSSKNSFLARLELAKLIHKQRIIMQTTWKHTAQTNTCSIISIRRRWIGDVYLSCSVTHQQENNQTVKK